MAHESGSSSEGAVLAPELMARVRQIQVRTKRLVSSALAGAYRSSFRGTGIEFEDLREYQPGDDTRDIDWKVTARTGEPFIKTYVEDRQLVLMFLVDASHSMDFGSGERTKREVAAELCALLAYVAMSQEDQVGLCAFADEPGLHLEPRKGGSHVQRVVREVIAAPPGGKSTSLAAVLEHQMRVLRRRSMVFVVSDFHVPEDDPAGDWVDAMARLSRKHDVIAARVSDPFEEQLPEAGILALREIESGELIEVDTRSEAVRRAWRSAAHERRELFLAESRRARVDTLELSTVGSVADPLLRLFASRGGRRGGA